MEYCYGFLLFYDLLNLSSFNFFIDCDSGKLLISSGIIIILSIKTSNNRLQALCHNKCKICVMWSAPNLEPLDSRDWWCWAGFSPSSLEVLHWDALYTLGYWVVAFISFFVVCNNFTDFSRKYILLNFLEFISHGLLNLILCFVSVE